MNVQIYEKTDFTSATFDPAGSGCVRVNVTFHYRRRGAFFLAALLEASHLSADSTNDHIDRKFIRPAVFPQHKLVSVRMRLIGFKSTFQSGETRSLSFPPRVCFDPADPNLPSKCLSLFLKFVGPLCFGVAAATRQSPEGRKGKGAQEGRKRRKIREHQRLERRDGGAEIKEKVVKCDRTAEDPAGTCGSPLLLPSESDCWSGSFSSPFK